MGASQAALIKLGKEKGYRLVGSNRLGYNLIFVQNDLAAKTLPEIKAISLPTELEKSRQQRLDPIKNLNWVDV